MTLQLTNVTDLNNNNNFIKLANSGQVATTYNLTEKQVVSSDTRPMPLFQSRENTAAVASRIPFDSELYGHHLL